MSDSVKKTNSSIKDYVLQGLYALIVFILILLALMLLSSLILSHLGQPEVVYGWMGYVLVSLAAFIVGKYIIKAKFKGFYPWLAFVMFAAVSYILLSLILGNGKLELISFILFLLLTFILSFLGLTISSKTKKPKKRSKHKSHR